MRFLRRFKKEETLIPLVDIQRTAQEHLIDLIDKGFSITLPPSHQKYNGINIAIPKKPGITFTEFHPLDYTFKWDDVKDAIINFCLAFKDEYEIFSLYISEYKPSGNEENDQVNIDDIENYSSNKNIRSVYIKFNAKTFGVYRNNILVENVQLGDKLSKELKLDEYEYERLKSKMRSEGYIKYLPFVLKCYGEYLDDKGRKYRVYTPLEYYIYKFDKNIQWCEEAGLDITKYNNKTLNDINDDYWEAINRKKVVKFVNYWAPASLRKEIKDSYLKDLERILIEDTINNYSLNNKMSELKKGSRCKSAAEWVEFVKLQFSDDNYSLEDLKASNIKIIYEDSEWLIYKALDYKSYLLPRYKYWCTMTDTMYHVYNDRNDMILLLYKSDKTKSLLAYKKNGEIHLFKYINAVENKMPNVWDKVLAYYND